MKKTLALLALAALAAATLVGPASVASAKKKKSGPVVVGTDPAGDWGAAAGAPPEAGDPLGQDLVGATIGMGEPGMINFVIELNALPPTGGMPEFTRYTWDFTVNGELMELDGKFTNYSRGACDPTSGQCPPPRDPGMQPFLIRGNCTVDNTTPVALTLCEEFAKVQGIFDTAAGTITIPVPAEALGAKPGAKIVGALGTFSSTISATPSAFFTNATMPMDGLITTKTFTVPK